MYYGLFLGYYPRATIKMHLIPSYKVSFDVLKCRHLVIVLIDL